MSEMNQKAKNSPGADMVRFAAVGRHPRAISARPLGAISRPDGYGDAEQINILVKGR
jgi:hypothetical protein